MFSKLLMKVYMDCLIQSGRIFFNCFFYLLGFITDGNSFLLGNVLLRQLRIPNATLFPASLQEQVKPYPQHQEDTENYGVGWDPPDTNITKLDSIWHYQNQESLGGSPIQGEFATYSGGGYVVRLGRNSTTATRWVSLSENRRTRMFVSGHPWDNWQFRAHLSSCNSC